MDYELYKRLRAGRHPLMPRPVSEITRQYKHGTPKPAYDLDLEWSSRVRPYGGRVADVPLDAADLRERGFDPAYLTARVEAAVTDWPEDAADQIENIGFTVEPGGDLDTRPTHESVEAQFGERRSSRKWISLPASQHRWWLEGPAWKGMARGVQEQVRHEVIKAACEAQVEWVRDVMAERIVNHDVTVTVYWRGEPVGSASVGGCQFEGTSAEVSEVIDDNDLVEQALEEAERWADAAVRDAQRRAAEIVESIGLLPERSIEAVRATYRTASVTNIRREA